MSESLGVSALRKRNLSVPMVVSFIYCAVAAGAFGIEEMIPVCGPGMTIALLIGLALLWALPLCFVIAELSSVMPCEGGYFYWAKTIFGEFWGFQVGWWNAVDFYVCGSTFVVLAVSYLSSLTGMSEAAALALKFAIVIVFAVINLRGIREAGWVSTAFSVVILAAFAALSVVGLSNMQFDPMVPFLPEDQGLLQSLGEGLGIAIWMYLGWDVVVCVAGEIERPSVLPRSLLVVVPLVAASYIIPTVAGLGSVGEWESWTTLDMGDGIGFQTVLEQFVGPWAAAAFLIVAIIGQLAIYNTNVAGGSRAFFVLADSHLFPRGIAHVSKRYGVPDVGIITISLVSIILVQFPFTTLVLIQVVCALASTIMTCLGVLRARKVLPVEGRGDAMIIPGGKFGLYLCALLPLCIAVFAYYLNGADYFLIGILFFAITGPLLYVIFKRRYGGLTVEDPDAHPINPRTKLAPGDVRRISTFFGIAGLASVAGSFILRFVEGEWGPEYYAEVYGDAGAMGFLANFDGILLIALVAGIIMLALSLGARLLARRLGD